MTRTVWSYKVPFGSEKPEFELDIPKGATFLSVRDMEGGATMWFEVDPNATKEKRRFEIVGTGKTIKHEIGTYLGTVLMPTYAMFVLVFHLYEVIMEQKPVPVIDKKLVDI